MEIMGQILIVIAIALFVISDIFILIKAFKTSLLWGFGSLFIPVVGIAYIIVYWNETSKYVGWFLLSIVLFIVGGTIASLE